MRVRSRSVGRPRGGDTPLSRWIDASGKARDEVAARLQIERRWLDKLCRGAGRPSLDLALHIEKLTAGAVPAASWRRARKA